MDVIDILPQAPVTRDELQGLATPVPLLPATVEERQGLVTPNPKPLDQQEPQIPVSGAKRAAKEFGRGLGWVTYPIWRPLQEILRDTKKVANIHRIPKAHALGWLRKSQADGALYEAWTPAERVRVLKQQAAWFGFLALAVVMSLSVGHYLPMVVLSLAWWARSHSLHLQGKLLPHFDLVRWMLFLPQVPENVYAGTPAQEPADTEAPLEPR